MPLDAGLKHFVHRPAPPIVGKNLDLGITRKALRLAAARMDLMSMTPSPIMPRSLRISLVGTSQSQTWNASSRSLPARAIWPINSESH